MEFDLTSLNRVPDHVHYKHTNAATAPHIDNGSCKLARLYFGGNNDPTTCHLHPIGFPEFCKIINYVNMQYNYVNMRLIYDNISTVVTCNIIVSTYEINLLLSDLIHAA